MPFSQIAAWFRTQTPYLIAVGLVSGLGVFYAGVRKADAEDRAQFFEQQTEMLADLRSQINVLQVRIDMLERENAALRSSGLAGGIDELMPFAMWVKSAGTYSNPGELLAMNKLCERTFYTPSGISRQRALYRTDIETWGEQLGRTYWNEDMKVIRSGKSSEARLPHPYLPGEPNPGTTVRVFRWPRIVDGQVVSVVGVAIPD